MNSFQKIALGGGVGIVIIVIFFAISEIEEPELESIDPEAIEMLREVFWIEWRIHPDVFRGLNYHRNVCPE